MDMPRLVLEIKQVEKALVTIEELSDQTLRNTVIQQPNIQPQRRNSSPRRVQPQARDNSYKKLKHRFDYQFKSLVRIIDGQPQMDSATVDQAKVMYKDIATLQQTLDKSANVITDSIPYQVNEKLEE